MAPVTYDEVILWLQDKLQELGNETDRKNVLLEIRSASSSIDTSILERVAPAVRLNNIFDCLNCSDPEQIELATIVLSFFISHSPKVDILRSYAKQIQRALIHPTPIVKKTFLQCLEECLNDAVVSLLVLNYVDLVLTATECIASPDLGVAHAAMSFLKKLGKYPAGQQLMYSDSVLLLTKMVMTSSEIVRFRVYEVAVEISLDSQDALQAAHDSEILQSLLSELKSFDCLLQLNTLQLLSTLVKKQHGLVYLQQQGVIEDLVNKVICVYDEPMPYIILPGLIQFFGNLIKLNPLKISDEYPVIITTLFDSIDKADDTLLSVLITTVGHIGSVNEGKVLLLNQGEKMTAFLHKLSGLLNGQSEVRVTSLKTLSVLLRVQPDENLSSDLVLLTETWFKQLGDDIIPRALKVAKLPFVDQRLAALEFLATIGRQSWGVDKLAAQPGLVEYLLDRSTEFEKNCKYAKYELVQNIVNCDASYSVFGNETYLKMKEFVSDGPFYVESQPEMAFEGST